MNKQLSDFSIRACLLLALSASLAGLPALAADGGEATEAASANSAGMPQPEISWMSGGVGDEALQEMRKAAGTYNVHVLFTNRQGSYLADVPFAVTGRDGRKVHSGVSDGPLLYLRLPAGAYRVSAEIDGVWQHRAVRVASAGRPAKLSFVARGD